MYLKGGGWGGLDIRGRLQSDVFLVWFTSRWAYNRGGGVGVAYKRQCTVFKILCKHAFLVF